MSEFSHPGSLLFVCMGNICRSPTAAAVVRHRLLELGLDKTVLVESAATHAYQIGQPAHPDTIRAAASRGYELSAHRARLIQPGDFNRFDLIIPMDRKNLSELRLIAPQGAESRIRLMMSFAEYLGVGEIPDPYGGPAAGFERVLDLVEAATTGLIRTCYPRRGPGSTF